MERGVYGVVGVSCAETQRNDEQFFARSAPPVYLCPRSRGGGRYGGAGAG
ncbi:unnamed protein product, partial [Strongylus vulgaris]